MNIDRDDIVECLRVCANYVSEHADNIVGDSIDRCGSISVMIRLCGGDAPTVTVEREYCPNVADIFSKESER